MVCTNKEEPPVYGRLFVFLTFGMVPSFCVDASTVSEGYREGKVR
jgi:hypothetical protein